MNKLNKIINEFFEELEKEEDIEEKVYNEFSLQHELGFFIREKLKKLGYRVQFEKNVKDFPCIKKDTTKKEMDIVVSTKDKKEKYAIELKFPKNRMYPVQMYKFIEDIVFMQEVKGSAFKQTYSIVLVNDKNFYEGNTHEDKKDKIYKYFRSNKFDIKGEIKHPTEKNTSEPPIEVKNEVKIEWKPLKNNEEYRYYIIEI